MTLIIGGGYHGKSTLLQALEQGVYNHVKGDGREYVITRANALKLRAEDGRAVSNLDLSLFIHDLPNGKDTHCFSTEDASGSTSQAAGVMEGIEAGTSCFLIDETLPQRTSCAGCLYAACRQWRAGADHAIYRQSAGICMKKQEFPQFWLRAAAVPFSMWQIPLFRWTPIDRKT